MVQSALPCGNYSTAALRFRLVLQLSTAPSEGSFLDADLEDKYYKIMNNNISLYIK